MRPIHTSLASLALFCAVWSPPALAQTSSEDLSGRVAVMEFTAGRDVDPGVARALSELAMARIQTLGLGECIGASEIKSLLNFEMEKQLLNCEDDAACVAEIGGALGVERLMTGTVAHIGSQYLVSLKLFDVRNAKVLSRVTSQVDADEDNLLAAIPTLVVKLFEQESAVAAAGQAPPTVGLRGTLLVRSDPSHSMVTLNGNEVGKTPLKLKAIRTGTHQLQITHTDYSTHIDQVTVIAGQDTIVEVELELDRELAERNYQFMLKRHENEVLWQVLGGIGHSVGGGLVGLLGTGIVLNALEARPETAVVGGVLAALGAGWIGWGVYQILSTPEPPPPPWADEATAASQPDATGDSSAEGEAPRVDPQADSQPAD